VNICEGDTVNHINDPDHEGRVVEVNGDEALVQWDVLATVAWWHPIDKLVKKEDKQ
jgi:hypothetical protein